MSTDKKANASGRTGPIAHDLGKIRVGRLPTINQDEYPGLSGWWVQLRIGEDGEEVLARVYGNTPEQAHSRATALAGQPSQALTQQTLDDVMAGIPERDAEIETLRKENAELREQLEAIGAGGVNGKLMPGAVCLDQVRVLAWRARDGHGLPQTDWIDGDPGEETSAWVGGDIECAYSAPVAAPVSAEPIEMGLGKIAIGGCMRSTDGAPGVIYLKMPDAREINADCTDIYPVGTNPPDGSMLACIYFLTPESLQQSINVLIELQDEHYPKDNHVNAEPDYQMCRQAYDDFYHKIRAEIGYDHWCSIWRFIAKRLSAPVDSQEHPEDDSIALDRLANYIADTWPMDKKYGIEEICQRLHAMWPGEFMPAAKVDRSPEMQGTPVDETPKLQGQKQPVSGADVVLDGETCQRCQGNGEIVTDWERYKNPRPGDVGDEAVTECPDCDGAGNIESAAQPQPSGNAGELPRLPLNDPAAAYRVLHDYGQSCARAALAQQDAETGKSVSVENQGLTQQTSHHCDDACHEWRQERTPCPDGQCKVRNDAEAFKYWGGKETWVRYLTDHTGLIQITARDIATCNAALDAVRNALAPGVGVAQQDTLKAEVLEWEAAAKAQGFDNASELTRWNPLPGGGMNPQPNGMYVRFDEIAKLTKSSSQQDASLIRTLCEALDLARTCHGAMLMSDPPKDMWKVRGVDQAISKALHAAGYYRMTAEAHATQQDADKVQADLLSSLVEIVDAVIASDEEGLIEHSETIIKARAAIDAARKEPRQ